LIFLDQDVTTTQRYALELFLFAEKTSFEPKKWTKRCAFENFFWNYSWIVLKLTQLKTTEFQCTKTWHPKFWQEATQA
jgi:hypothetical protein